MGVLFGEKIFNVFFLQHQLRSIQQFAHLHHFVPRGCLLQWELHLLMYSEYPSLASKLREGLRWLCL